jgi:hypothetical protein
MQTLEGPAACDLCGQKFFFGAPDTIAVGREGNVVTQLTGCDKCRQVDDDVLLKRIVKVLNERHGHTEAVAVTILVAAKRRRRKKTRRP